jgi:MFS family permease
MRRIRRTKQQETGSIFYDWRVVLAILSCIGITVMFDETMILPAIPDLIHQFNITYSTSIWILSYIIAGAVMTPIAGKLSDLYGRKKILLPIMAIYSIGLLSGRFSTSIELMVISRIAQGIGIAMFPIAFGIIRDVIPMEKLAIAQTIFGSTFAGGAVVGVVVGAIIIQNYGWTATFLAIFPISLTLLFVVWRFIKLPESSNESNFEDPRGNANVVENSNIHVEQDINKIVPETRRDIVKHSLIQKIDLKGILALAITIASFLVGISSIENTTINNFSLIGIFFLVSAISLMVFVIIEKKASLPLLNLNLITNKLFITPIIVLMIVSMSIFMVYQTIPVMVRSPIPLGFGGDALATANIQFPFMIVLFIGTILSGFLLNRLENIRLLVYGTAISTLGFVFLFLFHSSDLLVSAGLTVISCGLALSMAGVFNVILLSVPMKLTGIALGMTVLLNLIGMSIGPALGGIFQQLNQGIVPGIAGSFPNSNAYSMIFLTALILSLISFILAMMISKRNGKIVNEVSKPRDDLGHTDRIED